MINGILDLYSQGDMLNQVISYLFPKKCVILWLQGSYLSKEKTKELQSHEEICYICKKHSDNFLIHRQCRQDAVYYDQMIIWFHFDNKMKKLVYGIKYYHKSDYKELLWKKLSIILQCHIDNNELKDSLITEVPIHRIKKWLKRGYNQSQLLAQEVSKNLEIPSTSLFSKTRYTISQTKKSKDNRQKNLNWSFILNKTINNKLVIIIDDIVTTWSTFNELAKLIKSNNPNIKVICVALARNVTN